MRQHVTGTQWKFTTARFTVKLRLERDLGYQYDGDDEDGETQRKLDAGEYVAFTSIVTVELDGKEIGRDVLGGSVYGSHEFNEFWTAHRDPKPMNRNCEFYRSVRGQNAVLCHYFPDMVRIAVKAAREYVAELKAPPRLRTTA